MAADVPAALMHCLIYPTLLVLAYVALRASISHARRREPVPPPIEPEPEPAPPTPRSPPRYPGCHY